MIRHTYIYTVYRIVSTYLILYMTSHHPIIPSSHHPKSQALQAEPHDAIHRQLTEGIVRHVGGRQKAHACAEASRRVYRQIVRAEIRVGCDDGNHGGITRPGKHKN